jgi:hypothetical protein
MLIGNIILSVVDFLTVPVWHLVVLYVILFAIVIWTMVKSWGF